MKIAIGIDTGGTYTDAVMFDLESGQILGTAKSPTTRENLCVGIAGAIDGLPADLLSRARMLSLSTTLATNAGVEDRGGRARLVFLGGDKRVLDRCGADYGLPPAEEILLVPCKTTLSGQMEAPDWETFEREVRKRCGGLSGVGVVELYAMKNDAVLERDAKARIERLTGLPVTCGHELFSELNSLQRGASTLLNARLFPIIEEFLEAVGKVMRDRNVSAPVVMVRSDGSLMTETFARRCPVETLLCGPASSVMGGFGLTHEKNCVVVDMGGTTTDAAVIEDGRPVRAENGVKIGKWRTFVNGMLIRTFGLGGDSAIRYRDRKMYLESFRVIPLCAACAAHPEMLGRLQKLAAGGRVVHTHFRHEFCLLVKEPDETAGLSEPELALCRALKAGPLPLEDAAAAMGRNLYTFDVSRLVQAGVLQFCGFTPTDVMHVRGDFNRYPKEISLLAAEIVAQNVGMSVEALCDAVYAEIKRKIYFNVVELLLHYQDEYYQRQGFDNGTEHLIERSYRSACDGVRPAVSAKFETTFKLVGLGAPIRLFLPDVAALLGTQAIIPPHAEVANALGAVTGNVYASGSAEIRPVPPADGKEGFVVFGPGGKRNFEELAEAEAFAIESAESAARAACLERGAVGSVAVSHRLRRSAPEIQGGSLDTPPDMLFLGETVTAEAVGNIGLN